jgi:hypothetical protein
MTPARKTTIIIEGLARLIGSAQTPYTRGLLEPWLAAFQDIEDATWEVVTLRFLDPAEGIQLDRLGVLLGAPRGNLTDVQYKVRLRAQIIILRAEGVPPQLEQLLALCCPYNCTFDEQNTATLLVSIVDAVDPAVLDIAVLFDVLVEAKAAGVRLQLEFSPVADTFLFADFDAGGYTVPVYDEVHGLGDAADTYGGRLSAVLVTP